MTFSQTIFSFSPEISGFPLVACHREFLQCGPRLNSLKLGASLIHHLSVWPFPPRIPAFPGSLTWPGLADWSCNRVTLAEGLAEKPHDIHRDRTMDDSGCHDFFLHPDPTMHRRYEALRAVFLDHRPLAEVARQFGYRHGTLRNLVAQFRAQCRTGQVPPFSPPRLTGAPKEQPELTLLQSRIPRPRPIAIDSF